MDSFEKMFCPFVRKYLLSRRLSGLGTDQMLGQYPKYDKTFLSSNLSYTYYSYRLLTT